MGNAVKIHDERKNKQAAPWLNTKDVEKLREELRKMRTEDLRVLAKMLAQELENTKR